MFISIKLLTFFFSTFCFIQGLVVIPERANVIFKDKRYVEGITMNVRRYSRKSPYFINLYGTTHQQWNNNITVDVIFSQFLHNEYRRSFIEMHYKMCDLINDEPFIGGMLKKSGLVCPLTAGLHYFMNMTVPTHNFRNVFPFEKGRVDITASLTATKERVLHLFLEASFKQDRKINLRTVT